MLSVTTVTKSTVMSVTKVTDAIGNTVRKPTVISTTKVTNAIGNHGNISHKETAELQLHSFLSPAMDGGISSQLHAPAVLPSVNSIHYPRRWRLGGPQRWSVLPLSYSNAGPSNPQRSPLHRLRYHGPRC
jgi:hypothetical protein